MFRTIVVTALAALASAQLAPNAAVASFYAGPGCNGGRALVIAPQGAPQRLPAASAGGFVSYKITCGPAATGGLVRCVRRVWSIEG